MPVAHRADVRGLFVGWVVFALLLFALGRFTSTRAPSRDAPDRAARLLK
jgi:hypothetical protein